MLEMTTDPAHADRARARERRKDLIQKFAALGSLVNYITRAEVKHFQPANMTFDLLEPLSEEIRRKVRDKKERHRMVCERALAAFDAWWAATFTSPAAPAPGREVVVARGLVKLPEKLGD